jgi:uncharacterized protein
MPTYLTPGVYAEELPSAGAPIDGVGVSVAGFVGLAPGGPVQQPVRVSSWSEFAAVFSAGEWDRGPFVEHAHLAHAVLGYFQNGGSACWVVRVADESERGLDALSVIDEISMVAAPDLVAAAAGTDDLSLLAAQQALIAHCEMAGDRLAILDPPPQLDAAVMHEWRMNRAGYDSRSATLYWPWVVVTDPLTNRPVAVPPSGHVAGVWARVDAQRGVHKAPANEVVRGVVDLASHITASEQAPLNSVGVNCMRAFAGRGIRIWGARTLSSDPEWRELGVRRLVTHVSDTIARGTGWATFEPNDERLWLQLRVAVANYLTRLWRDGALVGRVPAEAFFVKCDEDTNPRSVIEAGQLVIEVGLALAHAAEFVVFRISHARSAALGAAS